MFVTHFKHLYLDIYNWTNWRLWSRMYKILTSFMFHQVRISWIYRKPNEFHTYFGMLQTEVYIVEWVFHCYHEDIEENLVSFLDCRKYRRISHITHSLKRFFYQNLWKLVYSEVPNKSPLKFFRFSFHHVVNEKFHSARLLIYLVNKQAGWHFFQPCSFIPVCSSIRDYRVGLSNKHMPVTLFGDQDQFHC